MREYLPGAAEALSGKVSVPLSLQAIYRTESGGTASAVAKFYRGERD
jgi:hypothetical protein